MPKPVEPTIGRINSTDDFMIRWDELELIKGKPDPAFKKLFGQSLIELLNTQGENQKLKNKTNN